MSETKSLLIFLCFGLILCDSAFVDTYGKCSIHDFECQRKLYENVLHTITKTGMPEYGIPPIDPFVVKNESVTVLDLVTLTMVDGVAKGIKSCTIDKVFLNIDDNIFNYDFTCDIVVKGHYKVTSKPNDVIRSLLGGNMVHGEGEGKVQLEKLKIRSEYRIFLRKTDGEIYFDYDRVSGKFTYDLGKVKFSADNLYVDNQEVSKMVLGIINDNWKFIMQAFGRPFIQLAMDIFVQNTHKFFDAVPAREYIIEDLSPYLKN